MTTHLQAGDLAPAFESADPNGTPVSLNAHRGRKLLLAFFRFSACGLCNLRVQQFIRRYPDWREKGLDVIAVFESPEESLRMIVGKQNTPFPLLADPKAELYDLYGVEVSEEKTKATMADPRKESVIAEIEAAGFKLTHEEGSNFERIPAEFLIDEEGVVCLAHYGNLIFDHLPLETVDRFAAGQPVG
ncbi:peroxiredoxin-like family protein [Cohnella zeiphila]|uniref:AhpC/TSA family protein n=1 Tax=Cohnella zeiphila TaxID=2761120 RepID=A0A7X0VVA5_9BACL|nr:peroxiredoxin-like family protein [Cohnella zeiphila]MBB6731766.1 AhpC/TSA family protein [Cohnella zeiphila]